jgi:hypothetical protein
MKYISAAVIAVTLTTVPFTQAQTLAQFGSPSSNLFTIDENSFNGWTASDVSQTASGVNVIGLDDSGYSWSGGWASTWNLASNDNLQINITGPTFPTSTFSVTLYSADQGDGNYLSKAFDGDFSQAGVVGNNYSLTFNSGDSFTAVAGFTFTSGGTGEAMNISFNNLNAIPEPSTYALMALGGLVLFFIARRRKAQV